MCKVPQSFQRKALQVSLHRFKSTLSTFLYTYVAFSTHKHTCTHVFAILVSPSWTESWQAKMSFSFVPLQPRCCYTWCSLDVFSDIFLTKCSQCGSCKTQQFYYSIFFTKNILFHNNLLYSFEDVPMSYKKQFLKGSWCC